jgi:group I intron endonuclease
LVGVWREVLGTSYLGLLFLWLKFFRIFVWDRSGSCPIDKRKSDLLFPSFDRIINKRRMNNFSGIYGIRSLSHPERVYIGSAVNIRKRWWEHKGDLRRGNHHNIKMQRHYDSYGVSDLVFEVIIKCDVDGLISAEQIFLDLYKPWFNVLMVAESRLGMKHSNECRALMSKMRSGSKHPLYGMHHTEDAKRRMRQAKVGKLLSEEHKANIGRAIKGIRRSDETKKKMSRALKGRVFSEETRALMRAAWVRRRATKEN